MLPLVGVLAMYAGNAFTSANVMPVFSTLYGNFGPLILPPYLRTHLIRNVSPLPGRLSGVPQQPDAAGILGESALSTTSAEAAR